MLKKLKIMHLISVSKYLRRLYSVLGMMPFQRLLQDWVITDVEDIDWIADVFNQEPEIF